jgi:hypothetical protein
MAFAGLDDVPWAELNHAYGSAADVPEQIRALASGKDSAVEKAIWSLFGNIYHQGTVYSASAPAVPFLVEALSMMAPNRQAELLGLLASMAQGYGYYDVHRHLPFAKEAMEKAWVDDPEATLNAERSIVRDTTLAVFAQWDAIESCLNASADRVRIAALHVLATLGQSDASSAPSGDEPLAYLGVRPPGSAPGEWANRVRRRIDEALVRDLDSVERAACLRALLQMGATDHQSLRPERLRCGSKLERYVVMLACARAELERSERLSDEFAAPLAELADVVQDAGAVANARGWPWEEAFVGSVLRLFARLPESALDRVAVDCARLIRRSRGLMEEYDTILHLILGESRPAIPDDPCELSRGRREIAQAFLARPVGDDMFWFWNKSNGNASGACLRFNVPHDRRAWLKWLRLPVD